MLAHRALWVLAIALAAILYVMVDSVGTLAAFVCIVVVPLASGMALAATARHVRVDVSAPRSGLTGQAVTANLHVGGRGPVFAGSVRASVTCSSLLLGEGDTRVVGMPIGRRQADTAVVLQPACCGIHELAVSEVRLVDVFGIWCVTLGESPHTRIEISPQIRQVHVEMTPEYRLVMDGERYSMVRPGSDPSETFGLHEYREGDSVRNVHWKLTSKTDKLIVRELGLPIIDQVLLAIELSYLPRSTCPAADVADALVAAYLSMSRALVDAGIGHVLCWRSARGGELVLQEIDGEAGFAQGKARLLGDAFSGSTETTAACFARSEGLCNFAHVVVTSATPQPEADRFYNGNRVTWVDFSGQTAASGASEFVGVGADSWWEGLDHLEI